MSSPLAALRRTPQLTPSQFLAAHPGCWLQYFDDTPARDASKALAMRTFDPAVARRKQEDRCAVCFSLQAFGQTRTKQGLLCFRNMGVDVDLVPTAQRGTKTPAEIENRKDEYLRKRLLPFPLKPHWLVETRHGFHVIFRVQPQREPKMVSEATALNGRLVRALGGDENAMLLTQVLRVPGTFNFKDPDRPFLCRLLMDNASNIAPYGLDALRSVLDALEVFHGVASTKAAPPAASPSEHSRRWRERLAGVPEGQRNAAAASVIGGILAHLPEDFWNTAGWGGLKEWNVRNSVPLPERELRAVYESIARRELAKRRARGSSLGGGRSVVVHVDIHVRGRGHARHFEFKKSPSSSEERSDHWPPSAGAAPPAQR